VAFIVPWGGKGGLSVAAEIRVKDSSKGFRVSQSQFGFERQSISLLSLGLHVQAAEDGAKMTERGRMRDMDTDRQTDR